MDTLTIRQKLYEYIKVADDEQLEAMYTSIKNEVSEPYEWYNDEKLVAELERRSDDLESGKVQGIAWEDLKKSLLNKADKK